VSIPNFLSLFRIILVPVTVIFLIDGSFFTALAIFTLAGITDALDGFLARVLSQKTVLGAYLDPIADKALLTSCFVTLSILGIIPGWLAVIVVSRDFIILLGISVLFMVSVPFEIKPIFISKITTAVQIITVFLALAFKTLGGDGHPFFIHFLHWLTAGFTTISGFHYILRGIKAINHS
jgi:cardiolipin synthase (CMP-forming)